MTFFSGGEYIYNSQSLMDKVCVEVPPPTAHWSGGYRNISHPTKPSGVTTTLFVQLPHSQILRRKKNPENHAGGKRQNESVIH